ncbi:MAG: hypothetical protein R2748_07445 [Bryobacterales bacterium]
MQRNSAQRQRWNPGVAAVLSFVIPGLGQIYKRQLLDGFGFLFFYVAGFYFFVVASVFVWMWSVYNAATFDPNQPSVASSKATVLFSGALLLLTAALAYWIP